MAAKTSKIGGAAAARRGTLMPGSLAIPTPG